MKKILFVWFFVFTFSISLGFSKEIEINSEVISVDPELEFFIIKSGEKEGVELGDGLIVYREAQKIAEAYIIEVRPVVSAAEILNLVKNKKILEGDSILSFKKREEKKISPQKKIRKKVPKVAKKIEPTYKSKWTRILGPDREISSARPKVRTLSKVSGVASAIEEGDIIRVDIEREAKIVFDYARLVLRENGYSVTSSSKASGLLLATKPIELSLIKELWADAFAVIDHKIVVSLNIKEKRDSSILEISSFKEHTQKDKYIKQPVKRNSKYYSKLVELIYQIKEHSEY